MNLFTRKCFYEKTSKMPENLDTLLQLSTSGEEVVWFHGAVLRKKEQKTVSKLQTSGWAKYCQQTVSIFSEIILFYMSWYDFEENKKN